MQVKPRMKIEVPEGYEALGKAFELAIKQAAEGKGKERHACKLPFHQQQSPQITKRQGVGYPCGQAEKKLGEAPRLDKAGQIEEILGAMVYCGMAIIDLEGLG